MFLTKLLKKISLFLYPQKEVEVPSVNGELPIQEEKALDKGRSVEEQERPCLEPASTVAQEEESIEEQVKFCVEHRVEDVAELMQNVINSEDKPAEQQLIIAFPLASDGQNDLDVLDGNMPLGLLLNGELRDGILEGKGKVVFPCGKIVHGDFQAGIMNGYSVVVLPDGTVRQGEFKDNFLHGSGKITFPSGATIEGVFKRGKLIVETL